SKRRKGAVRRSRSSCQRASRRRWTMTASAWRSWRGRGRRDHPERGPQHQPGGGATRPRGRREAGTREGEAAGSGLSTRATRCTAVLLVWFNAQGVEEVVTGGGGGGGGPGTAKTGPRTPLATHSAL